MNEAKSKSQSECSSHFDSCTKSTPNHQHQYHQQHFQSESNRTTSLTFPSPEKQRNLKRVSSMRALEHVSHVLLTSSLLALSIASSMSSVFAAELDIATSMSDSSEIVTNFGSTLDSSSSSPWTINSSLKPNYHNWSMHFPPDMHVYNASSYKELELLSGPIQGLMSWLYGLTAAAALIGNIIAVLVLIKGKRMSKGTLRFFLINLALSDINVAAFSIPFTYDDFMKGRWEYWLFFCPVVQCMQITSVFVSVYTLAAIGVDRYVAIIHPLRSTGFSRPFILLSLPAIWAGGIAMGVVQYMKTDAVAFGIAGEPGIVYYDCKELWTPEQLQTFTLATFFITFGVPMAIIIFTYFSIGLRMFNRAAPGNADAGRDRLQQQANNKTLKMLIATVIVFACCWTPLQTLNMIIYYAPEFMNAVYDSVNGRAIYVFLTFGSHWLSTANSFINPIVYSGLSENFRHDLKFLTWQLLRRIPCCRPLIGPTAPGVGTHSRCGTATNGSGGSALAGRHWMSNGRPSQQTMSSRVTNSLYHSSSGSNSLLRNGNNNNKGSSSPKGSEGAATTAAIVHHTSGQERERSWESGKSRQSAAAGTTYHRRKSSDSSECIKEYSAQMNGKCPTATIVQHKTLTPGNGVEAESPLLVHSGQSVVMLLKRAPEGDAHAGSNGSISKLIELKSADKKNSIKGREAKVHLGALGEDTTMMESAPVVPQEIPSARDQLAPVPQSPLLVENGSRKLVSGDDAVAVRPCASLATGPLPASASVVQQHFTGTDGRRLVGPSPAVDSTGQVILQIPV